MGMHQVAYHAGVAGVRHIMQPRAFTEYNMTSIWPERRHAPCGVSELAEFAA